MTQVHVLYIAGWGRSGTTILGNILGQIPGFTAVGELRYFWERNLTDNYLCGCGSIIDHCPFWSSVIERAWGGSPPDPADMTRWRDRLRTRHLPFLLRPNAADRYARTLKPYLDELTRFYRAIQEVGQSRVIVDISKFPSYAYALSLLPDVKLSVLLMVRDPRAVAYSWLRPKVREGAENPRMQQIGTLSSSVLWL
ncbi:MAG: sulfotransferase, partial [Acidobacteria bacterium]|nr:sulfotransferase [Acidobacteriota bacterium]